jgi:hypothetical protein
MMKQARCTGGKHGNQASWVVGTTSNCIAGESSRERALLPKGTHKKKKVTQRRRQTQHRDELVSHYFVDIMMTDPFGDD